MCCLLQYITSVNFVNMPSVVGGYYGFLLDISLSAIYLSVGYGSEQ